MDNVLNAADTKSADTVETTPPMAQKPVTRKSVSLTAGSGSTFTRMVVLAKRTRSGAETSVMTMDKSKTVRRGMTSTHNTVDAAVAALQKLVSEAV